MHAFYAIAGSIVLLLTLVDIVWTAVGTHGGGPLSKHLSAWFWKAALALHRRHEQHRLLSFVGSVLLMLTVTFWVMLIWGGWLLVFSSDPHAIVDQHTKVAPGLGGRAFYVAYAMSSMGNGDYQPTTDFWRIATAITTIGGLGGITLAITYVLAVLSAVVEKRALGAYISDLGGTPRRILERSWTGEVFDSLNDHMLAITPMVQHVAEQHLAFPVLHYFHSESERSAATLRMAAFYELILLVGDGTAVEKRPPRMVYEPLRDAIGAYGALIGEEYTEPEPTSPPPPSLQILRDLGIPTVEESEFALCAQEREETRRALVSVVHEDGWSWNRVVGEKAKDER